MKKGITIFIIALVSIAVFYLQFRYEKNYKPRSYYQVYLDNHIIGVIDSKDELDEYISKQGLLIKNQLLEYNSRLDILSSIDKLIEDKAKKYGNINQYLSIQKNYHELLLLVDESGNFLEKDYEKVVEKYSAIPSNFKENISLSSKGIDNYKVFTKSLDDYLLEEKNNIISYLKEKKLGEKNTFYIEEYESKKMDKISFSEQVYEEEYSENYAIYLYAEDIYSPLGINVEKINSYDVKVSDVKDVYELIIKEKPCTIEGYQFRIKKSMTNLSSFVFVGGLLLDDKDNVMRPDSDDIIIYVTSKDVFEDAVIELEKIFAGSENYENYKNGSQKEIVDTGVRIDDIYVSEDITIKKTNISVGEKIYADSSELSSYLLYGENKNEKTVYAKSSDTVLSLSYKYGISVEEFFLSNPTFNSVNNIFYDNQPIVIAQTDPKISIVVETYTVEDLKIDYKTVEKYDSSLFHGYEEVIQKGVSGVERVSQNVRSVNGSIAYINPVSNVTIKSPQDKILLIGTKVMPTVGSTASWYWPTKSGYHITSYFGYRSSPFTGKRELHSGLDISGTGYGSPVYASNNGTVYSMIRSKVQYGIHMIIDHHNGFYTLYAHMSGFANGLKEGATVSRGQVIGYVGQTGAATGPHLHFEVRTCPGYSCVVNPLPYLKR